MRLDQQTKIQKFHCQMGIQRISSCLKKNLSPALSQKIWAHVVSKNSSPCRLKNLSSCRLKKFELMSSHKIRARVVSKKNHSTWNFPRKQSTLNLDKVAGGAGEVGTSSIALSKNKQSVMILLETIRTLGDSALLGGAEENVSHDLYISDLHSLETWRWKFEEGKIEEETKNTSPLHIISGLLWKSRKRKVC